MGVENINKRESEIINYLFDNMSEIEGINILGPKKLDRLGVISFNIDGMHYNLATKLLNDKYGIQVRGGCACAGTYGHLLFNIGRKISKQITNKIDKNDLSEKPGFVRLSVHPTTTTEEVETIIDALKGLTQNRENYKALYVYDKNKNEFYHKDFKFNYTSLFEN